MSALQSGTAGCWCCLDVWIHPEELQGRTQPRALRGHVCAWHGSAASETCLSCLRGLKIINGSASHSQTGLGSPASMEHWFPLEQRVGPIHMWAASLLVHSKISWVPFKHQAGQQSCCQCLWHWGSCAWFLSCCAGAGAARCALAALSCHQARMSQGRYQGGWLGCAVSYTLFTLSTSEQGVFVCICGCKAKLMSQ